MKKKIVSALCVLALFTACAGCGKGEASFVSQITERQALKVDGQEYSVAKAKVYLTNYQNLYGYVYGVNLWKEPSQKESLTRYVKNLTVAQLTKILSMDSLAKSRGIALTEAELAAVSSAAEAYFGSLGEADKAYLAVSAQDVEQLYQDYALAQKLYHQLTAEINSEVSDDEARIMEAMQIVVKSADKAKEVKKALRAGGDFTSLANSYNEADEVKLQFGRGALPKEVEQAAFALDNGEISECIRTEQGYYFICCVNKFNEKLTDANKAKIVKKREKEAFGDVYDAYSKTISKKLYQRAWDKVSPDLSVTTDSFFAVYEEHCGSIIS